MAVHQIIKHNRPTFKNTLLHHPRKKIDIEINHDMNETILLLQIDALCTSLPFSKKFCIENKSIIKFVLFAN